jgi:hypothetical protein
MWRDLVTAYALRAREFSDAVAKLGKHEDADPEFINLMIEIKRRMAICQEAADELDRHIERQHREGASS